MTARRKIDGFTRVGAPAHCVASRVGWVRCDTCGKVIQASGLGIGSHRRSHLKDAEKKGSGSQ